MGADQGLLLDFTFCFEDKTVHYIEKSAILWVFKVGSEKNHCLFLPKRIIVLEITAHPYQSCSICLLNLATWIVHFDKQRTFAKENKLKALELKVEKYFSKNWLVIYIFPILCGRWSWRG